MQGVCELLDGGTSERLYSAALEARLPAINDPECTPSARLLADMRANKEPFSEFAMRMSKRHEQYFKQLVLPEARAKQFKQVAEESLQRQREIEAADEVSFEEYLKRYFAQS
jgi:glutamate--cysteine ligase